jgi:hypothetical protein
MEDPGFIPLLGHAQTKKDKSMGRAITDSVLRSCSFENQKKIFHEKKFFFGTKKFLGTIINRKRPTFGAKTFSPSGIYGKGQSGKHER